MARALRNASTSFRVDPMGREAASESACAAVMPPECRPTQKNQAITAAAVAANKPRPMSQRLPCIVLLSSCPRAALGVLKGEPFAVGRLGECLDGLAQAQGRE